MAAGAVLQHQTSPPGALAPASHVQGIIRVDRGLTARRRLRAADCCCREAARLAPPCSNKCKLQHESLGPFWALQQVHAFQYERLGWHPRPLGGK